MKRLLFIGLGAIIVIGLLIGAAFYLQPQDSLSSADAIIAVSGGDTVARAREAARLYKEGWAPLIIFSGAAKDPQSPSNAAAMRQVALGEGVPSDVISLDEQSTNTRQNANEVSSIVEALHFKNVILVTSPYHQRRAFLEFKDRLGSAVHIINHSAPDQTWSKRWWWANPRGWYLTVTELPKTLITQIFK